MSVSENNGCPAVYQKDVANIWIKYFTAKVVKREISKKTNFDPLLSAVTFIKDEDFDITTLKDAVQQVRDADNSLQALAIALKIDSPVSIQFLELARIAVTAKFNEVHEQYINEVNIYIMRTFIKISYNLKEALDDVALNKQSAKLPDIVFMYIKYFFMYFSNNDELFSDFKIVSSLFYKAMIKKIPMLMINSRNEKFLNMVYDILPGVFACIVKESGSSSLFSLNFLLSYVDAFVEKYEDSDTKIVGLLHEFVHSVINNYLEFAEYEKRVIHKISGKILGIFTKPHPKSQELYLAGLGAFSLEITKNTISFSDTIKECVHFIRWFTEESPLSFLDFPEIERTQHFPAISEDEKIEYLTVEQYKNKINSEKKADDYLAPAAIKEIGDVYMYVIVLRERAALSPELSLELADGLLSEMFTMTKKPSLQMFMCIVIVLMLNMNIFCINESIQKKWSIFLDENIFSIDAEKIESEKTKLFVTQMKAFVINFISKKCNANRKISKDIVESISEKLETQNDIFFKNLLPFFEKMCFECSGTFIPDFIAAGCHKTFIKAYKSNAKSTLGVDIFSFLQIICSLNPVPIFSDDYFIDFLFEMIQKENAEENVIHIISDALIAVAKPAAKEQIDCLSGLLKLIVIIYEKGNEQKEPFLSLSLRFTPILTNLLKISKEKVLCDTLLNPLSPLVAGIPSITKKLEDVKAMLEFIRYSLFAFPSLTAGLKPRSSKCCLNLVSSISSVSIDHELLDLMTTILFGHEAKFSDFGIVKNKEFIPVFLNSVVGKEQEKQVIDFILFLVSESRLNSLLCCEGQCFTVCLSRLTHTKPEENEIVKSLLLVITCLFEQFPSANFLLQMMPPVKAGLASKESFWPHIVFDFLKKLSRRSEADDQQCYISLVSSDSVIIGPTLPSAAFNGEWTFATTMRISDLSAKGSPLPLFSAKADKFSSISLMVKDNALVCTTISSRKSFKLQQFPYPFFQETWYFIEVFFSSSEIVFYCNNEKVGAVERLPIEFAGQVMISLGTFNDPKITKKSYADIRDIFIVSGNYVDKLKPGMNIDSIPATSQICSFKINTSLNGSMSVASPYGTTGKFIGYYLPPVIDFASLFETDGVWNSFFVLFFSAGNHCEATSDSPIAFLPKVMANIVKKNSAAEQKLAEIDGFKLIAKGFKQIEGTYDQNIFAQFFKLYKALRLSENKERMVLCFWFCPDIYMHLNEETLKFCVSCVSEIATNDKEILRKVVENPCIVDFFTKLSLFSSDKLVSPAYVVTIMNLVHSTMKSCRTQQCYEVLLNMLLTKLNVDILILCLQNVEDCLKTRNENFVSALKSLGGSAPFLQLVQNDNSVVRRLSLRCLQMVSLLGVATTKELLSGILSLTESIDAVKFDKEDVFFDCYDHLFAVYGTNNSIRVLLKAKEGAAVPDDFLPKECMKIRSPEFFPLLAASSVSLDRETVKFVVDKLVSNMNANPKSCDGIQAIPYWPYWVIMLCQSGYSSTVALTKLSQLVNVILYNSCSSGNYEPVRKALSLLDVVSHYLKINLLEEKKAILYSTFTSFPESKQTPENFGGFAASVFSILFVHPVIPFNDHITLGSNPFRLVGLDKAAASIKQIPADSLMLSVRLTNDGMWIDHDIASLTVELLAKWMPSNHHFDLAPNMPMVTIYSYMLSTMMQLMPSIKKIMCEKFITSFCANHALADTDYDHTALGIFLTIAKKYFSIDNETFKPFVDMFYFYNDDDDSYELEKYNFEENLLENIRSIYLINFV